jgi:hypothetical protein
MKFLMVWYLLIFGWMFSRPDFFIIAGVIALLSLLYTISKDALNMSQKDTQCIPHQWVKSISGTVYCEKCQKRPGED